MNKYEEGVDLNWAFNIAKAYIGDKAPSSLKLLEELVKRATPMKPIMSGVNQGLTFDVCPSCDKSLPHNSKFCSQCGQAIMRGDE